MTGDEMQLIQQLRNEGTRRSAFAELVSLHQQKLYYMVRRMVLVHEDADDVLQNTFVKAWQAIDSFRGDSSLATWLYRIATHEALDHLERKRRSSAISIDENAEGGLLPLADQLAGDTYFDGDAVQLQLQKAIAGLPHKQRLVFNLKYFDEMKYEQMSEVLGTSVGSLKASYHHAVQKISAFFHLND